MRARAHETVRNILYRNNHISMYTTMRHCGSTVSQRGNVYRDYCGALCVSACVSLKRRRRHNDYYRPQSSQTHETRANSRAYVLCERRDECHVCMLNIDNCFVTCNVVGEWDERTHAGACAFHVNYRNSHTIYTQHTYHIVNCTDHSSETKVQGA